MTALTLDATAEALASPALLALGEALAGRLCHDLAGLAGTVSNLLELADDDQAHAADARATAREAAASLLARLRLARAAWGEAIERPAEEWRALAMSAATRRVRVSVDLAALRDRPPAHARLLLNVALLGAEAVRGAGDVTLLAEAGRLRATLAGPAAAPSWPPVGAAALASGSTIASARALQPTWTALAAAACGASLSAVGPVLHIRLPA